MLTTGYGTEVSQQQVHVLQERTYSTGTVTSAFYDEVLVENPMAIILKNVTTKLSTHDAEVTIDGHSTVVNIDPLQIQPINLFPDISIGNYMKFDLVAHELIATVGVQISPASFIGEIKITYEYKSKMYQAKRIEFFPKQFK